MADLSVGSYSIPRGGVDDQEPHTEDEIYVVTAGQAVLQAGADTVRVGPGSVIYVAAGEAHRFTDITEDLAAVVLFAPAEGTRNRAGTDGPLRTPGRPRQLIPTRDRSCATGGLRARSHGMGGGTAGGKAARWS